MNFRLKVFAVIILFGLLAGHVGAATITFDKSLDVPDRTFTWENKTYYITQIGNYKLNENINFALTSGTDTILAVLYNADKNSVWSKTKFPNEDKSFSIPAGIVIVPGIYGIVASSKPDAIIIGANPLIISEYDLAVTPNVTNAKQGDIVKVTVRVSKNGVPVNVAPNNVEVKFIQDSAYFPEDSVAIATAIGIYEANIQIPTTAYGNHNLYAAITTGSKIYGYPEIIGAASGGSIVLPSSATLTPSSPGGSAGGGGAPSGEEFKNIEVSETYEKYISRGVPSSYIFRLVSNPVNEVSITSNTNAGDIAVKIEVLRDISSQVNRPASGIVYKNLNIIVGKFGFAVPGNIKEAFIKFRVENSWIQENNLASSDIAMERWDGSKWTPLETIEKSRDETYTFYESKTDTFSSFAITGSKPEAMPTVTSVITVTGTVIPTDATSEPVQAGNEVPGFEAAGAILALTLMTLISGFKYKV
ncbi:MAG: PGF-pre-PGF domain-containing protein [Candidatus Methanoperedens sp.]|nr:PGF-pre-PGF domain-containing protein [Candidatus Methanoperedens sp.]